VENSSAMRLDEVAKGRGNEGLSENVDYPEAGVRSEYPTSWSMEEREIS
jgi:hypothetical protein